MKFWKKTKNSLLWNLIPYWAKDIFLHLLRHKIHIFTIHMEMVYRDITVKIKEAVENNSVILIGGTHCTGKNTLVKSLFPQYEFTNLNRSDCYGFAKSDPINFLDSYKNGVIIDNAQNAPELLPHIQDIIQKDKNKKIILLSSCMPWTAKNKIFLENIPKFRLLPFSIAELKDTDFEKKDPNEYIMNGFYPIVVYGKEKNSSIAQYSLTFIRQDLRNILNVSDSLLFIKFAHVLAAKIGQSLNYAEIAAEVGISLKTARAWIFALERSSVIFLLESHIENYSKRIFNSPKLYFTDTGIACYLLKIKDIDALKAHELKLALFKNLVIADLMKNFLNKGQVPPLYFWHCKNGKEIDCIIDHSFYGKRVFLCVDIKCSCAITDGDFSNLEYYKNLNKKAETFLVNAGTENRNYFKGKIVSWNTVKDICQ